MSSGLFGITHSNRSDSKHWGKNCFNSSFPAAVASYMLEHDIPAIYVNLAEVDGSLKVVTSEIPISQIFNCGTLHAQDLFFSFESVYKPYQEYSFDPIDGIDLVVKDLNEQFLMPLEVKLTVLPDNSTYKKAEDKWGSEVVVRTATTSYCAFGMFDSVKAYAPHIREIFEAACSGIQSWDNDFEMAHKLPGLIDMVMIGTPKTVQSTFTPPK